MRFGIKIENLKTVFFKKQNDVGFLKRLMVTRYDLTLNISKEIDKLREDGDIESFKKQILHKIDNKKGRGLTAGIKQQLFEGGIWEGSVVVTNAGKIIEWLIYIKILLERATTINDVDKFIDEICEWGDIIIEDEITGYYKLCKVICSS